jgi:hypothetical protein
VLLVLQGKTRVEVAATLQAVRSSVNHLFSWYGVSGLDGLKCQRTEWPQQIPEAFKISVLKLLIKHRPKNIGYQRSRWITELLNIVLWYAFSLTKKGIATGTSITFTLALMSFAYSGMSLNIYN